MRTAKEMMEFTDRQNEPSINREMELVLDEIRAMAASGKYNAFMDLGIYNVEKVLENLEKLGYTIDCSPKGYPGFYTISWE